MGIHNTIKVMVLGYGSLLVISSLVCFTSASITCAHGKQYLSTKLETCVNCTECVGDYVVIRPCEIFRDTLCGPISELLKSVNSANPHRHRHHKEQHRNKNVEILWNYGDDVGRKNYFGEVESQPDVTSTEAPFSSAETLVWDWQAIALTAAVFACILFFLAITLYSLHQAKQWRRLKDNFDADVEELSARLGLITTRSEKGGILDPQITDGNYLNNRCVYLEQLLNVRKDTKIRCDNGGNVYIEEANTKT